MLKRILGATALVAFAGLAACRTDPAYDVPTTEEVQVALQSYHDAHPACFRVNVPFPTDNPGSRVMLKGNHTQVKALVEAGVVDKKGGAFEYHLNNKAVLIKTDNPTRDSNFCFGRYQVVKIISVGKPTKVPGGMTGYVEYEYQLKDVADWVRHPAMTRELFPKLHKQLALADKAKKAKAPMMQTKRGWVHFQMAQK